MSIYIFQDLAVEYLFIKQYLATPFTLEWNFRRGGLLLECVTRDTTVPISCECYFAWCRVVPSVEALSKFLATGNVVPVI